MSGGTLANRAAEALRGDILAGHFPPNGRLRLDLLRQRYGMGASPLREALSHLTADGLVVRVDQRGFRVAAADEAALRDLIRARCLMECAALREAVRRGDAAWEEGLLLAHHRLSRVPRSAAPVGFVPNPEWDARHRAFHLALIAACGSATLLDLCGALHDRATRFRNLSNAVAWPRRDVAVEHRALLDAALERRGEDAERLLEAHYRHTAELLDAALSAASPSPAARPDRGAGPGSVGAGGMRRVGRGDA